MDAMGFRRSFLRNCVGAQVCDRLRPNLAVPSVTPRQPERSLALGLQLSGLLK
jgi:hypothetical protein